MAQRRNNRNFFRRTGGRNNAIRSSDKVEWENPCPICGEKIDDITSAVTDAVSGEPAHFDCVLKKLSDQEELKEHEKICYLGNGTFGIVDQRQTGQGKFSIRKKIQYEDKEAVKDWRRGLIKTTEKDPRQKKEKK